MGLAKEQPGGVGFKKQHPFKEKVTSHGSRRFWTENLKGVKIRNRSVDLDGFQGERGPNRGITGKSGG